MENTDVVACFLSLARFVGNMSVRLASARRNRRTPERFKVLSSERCTTNGD